MQGNRRPCFSSAVQHAEFCPAYPFAFVRQGNISTTQHDQRKQQFPCPSLAVTALIQDVGIKHSSASTCWNSDPSVQFRKGWISSETRELNAPSHCVKWPVWKLLGLSTAGRAACLRLRWHRCATALSHEEKNRGVSEHSSSRTVQVQEFMYENQGSQIVSKVRWPQAGCNRSCTSSSCRPVLVLLCSGSEAGQLASLVYDNQAHQNRAHAQCFPTAQT